MSIIPFYLNMWYSYYAATGSWLRVSTITSLFTSLLIDFTSIRTLISSPLSLSCGNAPRITTGQVFKPHAVNACLNVSNAAKTCFYKTKHVIRTYEDYFS